PLARVVGRGRGQDRGTTPLRRGGAPDTSGEPGPAATADGCPRILSLRGGRGGGRRTDGGGFHGGRAARAAPARHRGSARGRSGGPRGRRAGAPRAVDRGFKD